MAKAPGASGKRAMAPKSGDRDTGAGPALDLRLAIDSWDPLHGWLGQGEDKREFRGWTGLSATLGELAKGANAARSRDTH
jgi:hypothetical protein